MAALSLWTNAIEASIHVKANKPIAAAPALERGATTAISPKFQAQLTAGAQCVIRDAVGPDILPHRPDADGAIPATRRLTRPATDTRAKISGHRIAGVLSEASGVRPGTLLFSIAPIRV
jgi:hypothetical protein